MTVFVQWLGWEDGDLLDDCQPGDIVKVCHLLVNGDDAEIRVVISPILLKMITDPKELESEVSVWCLHQAMELEASHGWSAGQGESEVGTQQSEVRSVPEAESPGEAQAQEGAPELRQEVRGAVG